MRKYILLSFLCIAVCSLVNAQGLFELKIKQLSLEPDFKPEQIHTLLLKNTSDNTMTFKIDSENVKCQDKNIKNEADLIQEIMLNNNSNKESKNDITVKGKDVYEFSIKIKKPANATLGSVNCTMITASTIGTKPMNKFVIIKSYVPNPKDAN